MAVSKVDQYLEDRRKRRESDRESNPGVISGNSKSVQSYDAEREKKGRSQTAIKNGVSSFNKNKEDYGIGFEPTYDLEDFAREFAARQQRTTPKKTNVTIPKRDPNRPYSKNELESMVNEYKVRTLGNKEQSISKPSELDRIISPDAVADGVGYTYKEIENSPDFSDMYKKGSENILGVGGTGTKQFFQEKTHAAFDDDGAAYMNQDEKNVYNYLLGKYGRKTAKNYLENREPLLNERMAQEYSDEFKNIAKEHPVAGTLINAASPLGASNGYINALTNSALGKETDINSKSFIPQVISEATNEGIKEKVRDTFHSGEIGDFLVDTGLSIGQSAARLPLGNAGLALAGGGAATGGYTDAINRGGTNEQALTLGALEGGAEALFEKFSLEGLQQLKASPVEAAKDVFINLLKQGGTEGSEELFTEIANTVSDRVVMGELSNYSRSYDYYRSQGMTDNQAKQKATEDIAKNVGLAFAGGALSGGIMGAGAMAAGSLEARFNNKANEVDNVQGEIENPNTESDKLESISKNQNNADTELLETAREFAARNGVPTELPKSLPDEVGAVSSEHYMEAAPNSFNETRDNVQELFAGLGKNGQKAAADNYDGNVELADYQPAFNRYYDAGRYNTDMESAEKAAITAVLTPEQASAAYKAGSQDRNIAMGKKTEYKKGAVKEGAFLNNSQRATESQKQFAQVMGKKTGLTFVLSDNLDSGAVGEYSAKSGVIKVSADSKNFLQTSSHELTHFIKDYDAEGYTQFKDVVVTSLMEVQNVSLEQLVNNYETVYSEKGQTLSRDDILDEIVADGTGQFLNDEDFIAKVTESNKSVAQRVIDFLSDLIDSVKTLISNKGIRAASKGLQENLTAYQVARELWVESLERASDTYKSGQELVDSDDIRFSIQEAEDGTKYVKADVEQEQFDGLNLNEKLKLAENIIMKKFRNKVIGMEPDNAFVNRESGKEYRHPAKFLKEEQADAKARVSTELDDLMSTAEFTGHYDDDGRHSDITGGWDHYTVKFQVGGEMFEGTISVGITKNGRVFKDLTKIKNISQGNSNTENISIDSKDSSGDVLNPTDGSNAGLRLADKSADSAINVSTDSISSSDKNINGAAVSKSKDIRYQLEEVDNQIRVTELVEENRNLKESVDYLQQQLTLTKDYKPRVEDIRRIAGNLLKTYNSTYKKDTLVKNLSRLYEYIRGSEYVDGKEVTEAATAIAKGVLNQSQQLDTEMTDRYKTVLKDLKSTPIQFDESQRSELDSVGGYNSFRRKYFGKLRLGTSGVDVDTAYQELSGKYPELFPDSIVNTTDQLLQMAGVVDSIKPQISNPYQADLDEMSYIVGQQIFDNYFDVRNLAPTKADRLAAEADRVRREYSKRMDNYRDSLKNRYQESMKAAKQQNREEIKILRGKYEKANAEQRLAYKQKMDELRDYKNLKIRAEQQLYQQKLTERRERTATAQTKKQIIKEVMELKTWLLNPTDKKHVPDGLRKTLAEFLGSIDFSSNRLNADGEETKRTKMWNQLQMLYTSISYNGGVLETDQGNYYLDIDPDLTERMNDLNEQVKNIDKLENLSYLELENVKKIVQAMKHSIQEADKLRANLQYQSLAKCMIKSFWELKIRKDKLQFAGFAGSVDRLMKSDMLDGYTMFNRIGPAAESIYAGLRTGLDRKIQNTKIAQDYIHTILVEQGITKSDIRGWSGKKAEQKMFHVAGGEIGLNQAQIMSLYVLNKRKQAQTHIYNQAGGIKAGAVVTAKRIEIGNGAVEIAKVIDKSNKPVRVTPYDVDHIIKILTPQQKAVADGIVKFFTQHTADWGNEVSMEMYGYKKFRAPDYFPIVTDRNSIATKSENVENAFATLKNLGSTKATVHGAANPIIIEDIFDVYTRQADQMGSYNAFMVPLSDLQKYYNFKHVDIGNMKQELERTFGTDVHKYIMQLMRDINGMEGDTKDFIEVLIRNMKSSAVGYNLRTAIQQPTAYVRALAEINGKYLIKGLKLKVSESEWELCKKYAPIAQWKDWGYFDVNTGRSMKSILLGAESLKEEMIESSMNLAGKGDEITWKRIWEAVKAETDELHPELSTGTESYYKQCGKRFSEIIDRTQVVDSVLHRSNLMKRKGLPQLYTSFMSEPAKSYNMLYRAWADACLSKSQNGKMIPKLRKRALTVSGIWGLTGVTTAIAASIVDAMRDDDDDELWEKYAQALAGNLLDNLNPLQIVPVIKDIMSIFDGFDVGRIDMQGFEQMSDAVNDLQKYTSGESKYTFMKVLQKFMKPISSLSGVAAYNLIRDTVAVLDTAMEVFGIDSLENISDKMTYRISSSKNTGLYVKKAMKAYASGEKSLGDKIIKELSTKGGIDTDKIDDKIKSLLKNDERIAAAAEARKKGDYSSYEAVINELEAEGISKDISVSMIRTKTSDDKKEGADEEGGYEGEEEKKEEKKTSLYESADLKYAFDAGNVKEFQRIADIIYKEKKLEGKTAAEIKKSMKTYLTGKYKEEYLNSDRNKRLEIQRKLEKLNLGGTKIYSDADFEKWISDYQKARKKK